MKSVILGFIIAAGIAIWGYLNRYLTAPGAVGACVVGGCIWVGGGWGLAAPLVFFFVVSSVLTKWSARRRESAPNEFGTATQTDVGAWGHTPTTTHFIKDGESRRTIKQVAANGTVATACAIATWITGDTQWLFGALCALAAMTGDTWSSELGRAFARGPFDLRTGKRVPAGISGAVSFAGSIAGLLGAAATTAVGLIFLRHPACPLLPLFLTIAGWAWLSVWVDSFLGATVQMRFRCPACNTLTDSVIHCDTSSIKIAGIPGVGNNAVNFLTTIFAALIIFLL